MGSRVQPDPTAPVRRAPARRALAQEAPVPQALAQAAQAPVATPVALADRLAGSWRAWRELLRRSLEPLGLSPWEARALEEVTHRGPLSMTQLAQALAMQPRSATSVVRALTRAGLVRRQSASQDRRVVLVTATPAGHQAVRAVQVARSHAAQACFGRLSSEERCQLAGLLDRLLETVGPRNPGDTP